MSEVTVIGIVMTNKWVVLSDECETVFARPLSLPFLPRHYARTSVRVSLNMSRL